MENGGVLEQYLTPRQATVGRVRVVRNNPHD